MIGKKFNNSTFYDSTISKIEIVQVEDERKINREIEVYNLDATIAVGYRINSIKATHFRIWATNTLREFITNHLSAKFFKSLECFFIIFLTFFS